MGNRTILLVNNLMSDNSSSRVKTICPLLYFYWDLSTNRFEQIQFLGSKSFIDGESGQHQQKKEYTQLLHKCV